MQVTKTQTIGQDEFFNKDRELQVKGSEYWYKGINVTPIVQKSGSKFISLMGSCGGKSFHNYFGLDDNGKWYRFTGVTSALDYVGDKSNLMQWYANQVVEQFGWSKQLPGEVAKDYHERVRKDITLKLVAFALLHVDEQVEFIKKARTAATQFARKTANLGKEVHESIENLIKDAIKHRGGMLDLGQVHPNAQVQHFIDWAHNNNVVFKASELQVYSKTLWYAGTLDFVAEINGDLYVGDIKTTSSVYGRSYFAQCAAYRKALEEMHPGRYTFSGSLIVRIGRDGLFDPETDIHFSPYYEDDWKYFASGLEIYRQENNVFTKN